MSRDHLTRTTTQQDTVGEKSFFHLDTCSPDTSGHGILLITISQLIHILNTLKVDSDTLVLLINQQSD